MTMALRRVAIVAVSALLATTAGACRFSRNGEKASSTGPTTTTTTLLFVEDTTTLLTETTVAPGASTASTARRSASTARASSSGTRATTRAVTPPPPPPASPHCTASLSADPAPARSTQTLSVTSTFPDSSIVATVRFDDGTTTNFDGYNTDASGSWGKLVHMPPNAHSGSASVTVAGKVHCGTSFTVS
jgi:hypothetical protein